MSIVFLWLALASAAPPEPAVIAACDTALAAEDVDGLQQCVEAWVLSEPDHPDTDWYAFHLAFLRGNATAAQAARNRALAHGLAGEKEAILKRKGLPPNPMITLQRYFLAGVLVLGFSGMIWARVRSMRNADLRESAEREDRG